MQKIDLQLVRTQKSDPVITVETRTAKEFGDGTLLWEGGTYRIWTGDGGDPDRYDGRIVEELIRSAGGWAEGIPGKKAKKLKRKLEKLLPLARKL